MIIKIKIRIQKIFAIKIFENSAKNIINNNFFINVGNLNNMELKIDEDFMKKISNNFKIIINNDDKNINFEINENKFYDTKDKINNKTVIKKIIEYGILNVNWD